MGAPLAFLAIALAILAILLSQGFGSVSVSITCPAGQHQVKRNTHDGYELWCAKDRRR